MSPPDKSPPGQKCPRAKDPPDKITPGQKSGEKTPGGKVPNGDIFYCSGSRQLNHSSVGLKLQVQIPPAIRFVVLYITTEAIYILYTYIIIITIFHTMLYVYLIVLELQWRFYVVKSQQSHGSETWNFGITFFTFFQMPLQKSVKSRFLDFQKNT